MDIGIIVQALGWAASVLAIFSYSLKSVRKIRVANCTAAAFFIAYGVMLDAPAIVIMNATLACVHVAYLVSHDRFGELVSRHFKIVMTVFGFYAAAAVAWVCATTEMDIAELVGIVSSVAFVGGFLQPREVPMRVTCSAALVLNIVYALLIVSPQVAVANGVSLTVNIVRLIQRHRTTSLLKNGGIEMTD